MKHKVGDKVRIKSKEWYERNKDEDGNITLSNGNHFWECMTVLLDKSFTIRKASDGWYDLEGSMYSITDEMIDDSFLYNIEKSNINEELIKDIAEVIKKHNLGISICENEGKLIIEPLKAEEEEDLPIDTPVMTKNDNNDWWRLRYYAGECKCYVGGGKSNNEDATSSWDCIIPFDKFNPLNIEESLKYNIVK